MKPSLLVFNSPANLGEFTHAAIRQDGAPEGMRVGNRFEIIVEAGNLKREYCEKVEVRP